ncbi:MAG: PilZ domain-containing protein [Thiotrichales bacterium]
MAQINHAADNSYTPFLHDRRKNVRVSPDETAPVLIYIQDEVCRAQDLSVGGVAFSIQSPGCYLSLPKPGYYFQAEILLPENTDTIKVHMEVLGHRPGGLARCIFRDLGEEAKNDLEYYVASRLRSVFNDYLGYGCL